MPETCRIDKWLWAVRIYKTRSLTAKACEAGKIKRLGKSLKPSASIRIGDHLEVTPPDNLLTRQLEVKQLLEKRVSAPLAREAYAEHTSQAAISEAEAKKSILRQERLFRQEGDQGRMTKKKRREWNKHSPFFGED
ncbi:MAG: RNA-binding S4 domain-containing protein [Verrucomicrobiota bacterium JB023]|nr:RNA-binding S4 domain-containing protein [Verrucomicrobiota bacterium JB023]